VRRVLDVPEVNEMAREFPYKDIPESDLNYSTTITLIETIDHRSHGFTGCPSRTDGTFTGTYQADRQGEG